MKVVQLNEQQYRESISELNALFEVFDVIAWTKNIKNDPSKLNGLFQSATNSPLGISGLNAMTMLALADQNTFNKLISPILKLHIQKFQDEYENGVLIIGEGQNLEYEKNCELKQLLEAN